MTDLKPFPDIELVLRELFLRDFADVLTDPKQVGVDFPTNDDILPFVRIEKTPMSRRLKMNDHPVVDIEVLHRTRGQAKSLIEEIDTHMLDYPHSVVISSGLAVLDMVTVPRSPSAQTWDSPNVRRFAGTYEFSVRR